MWGPCFGARPGRPVVVGQHLAFTPLVPPSYPACTPCVRPFHPPLCSLLTLFSPRLLRAPLPALPDGAENTGWGLGRSRARVSACGTLNGTFSPFHPPPPFFFSLNASERGPQGSRRGTLRKELE